MTNNTKRIQKDLVEFNKNPPPCISATPIEDNIQHWTATIHGPASSAYKGGTFKLDINLNEYPFKPPTIKFLTKIYHPNVDDNGEICLGILKSESWKPSSSISSVLVAIYDLLETPNPDDPLVTSIAELYNNDKTKFKKTAKEWVKKYAL